MLLAVAETVEKNYLERLFGGLLGGGATSGTTLDWGQWLLAVPATVFYGQIALVLVLWVLFSSDIIGIIAGFVIIGLTLAFTVPRRPRPIAIFVLVCLDALLAAGITVTVAFSESVFPVLISLLPMGGLVWWRFKQAFYKKTQPKLLN